ncbi:MAG: CDP-alcohol phosphatidyltransferase family protein [Candidatus Magasanikbacteria bacterium]
MSFIKDFKERNVDLFDYLPAEEIHPHDHFLENYILRFLPKSVTPNRISIFRILATPFVFLLILFGFYNIGVVAFVLVAFTDALDGSLARTQNKITKFGILIDPLADKLLIGSMVLLLVFKYLNNFWLGIAVLGIEIIFISMAYLYRVKFKTVRMANLWGKIKMFLQVLSICLILIALVFENPYLFNLANMILGLSVGFALVSLFRHGI